MYTLPLHPFPLHPLPLGEYRGIGRQALPLTPPLPDIMLNRTWEATPSTSPVIARFLKKSEEKLVFIEYVFVDLNQR